MTSSETPPPGQPSPPASPRRRSGSAVRRWGVRLLIGLAVVAAVAVSLWWLFLADRITRSVEGWITAGHAAGVEASVGTLSVSGFPFELAIDARELSERRPDGIAWTTPRMTGTASVAEPTRISVAVPEPLMIELPTAAGGPVTLSIDQIAAALDLAGFDGRRDGRATLTGVAVSVPTPDADAGAVVAAAAPAAGPASGRLTAAEVVIDASEPPVPVPVAETGLALALTVRSVMVPPERARALGPEIAEAVVEAHLTGTPPQLGGSAPLIAWVEAGGRLVVDRLSLRWGPLDLAASGELSLDADLQPMGLLEARVRGGEQVVDALAEAGLLAPNQAETALSIVRAFSRPTADEDGPVLRLPIRVGAGTVRLGPMVLATLPRWDWPPADLPAG